jgi:hypothetical protein
VLFCHGARRWRWPTRAIAGRDVAFFAEWTHVCDVWPRTIAFSVLRRAWLGAHLYAGGWMSLGCAVFCSSAGPSRPLVLSRVAPPGRLISCSGSAFAFCPPACGRRGDLPGRAIRLAGRGAGARAGDDAPWSAPGAPGRPRRHCSGARLRTTPPRPVNPIL